MHIRINDTFPNKQMISMRYNFNLYPEIMKFIRLFFCTIHVVFNKNLNPYIIFNLYFNESEYILIKYKKDIILF